MSILTTDKLGLAFGAFDVFQNISVRIAKDSKIGLIGPNGIGKTSLLRLLAGQTLPSAGHVHVARGQRLGYLRQEAVDAFAQRNGTVYAEMLTVFADLQARQARLHDMEATLASGVFSDQLLQAYGEALEAFELAGGYDYEHRIRQTLQGLGLAERTWEQPLGTLSGGQQTRAWLARLLLESPHLLILDEPTNHLDGEAVDWLEHTLREWPGALLIASHDRYFLDHVVDTIWDMRRTGLDVYSGNYSAYLQQRQERWAYYQQVFAEEKARLLKEADFVQRNIARATTNARAVGLLRRLSRDLTIVETQGVLALRNAPGWLEMDLGRVRPWGVAEAVRFIQNLAPAQTQPPRLRLKLSPAPRGGTLVLRAQNLRVGYPGRALFTAPALELLRGECAALLGANGSGKTTFLRTLLKEIEPLGGLVQLDAGAKVGYFSQTHAALDPERTVLEEFERHHALPPNQARSLLAQYLFRGDDVFKTVRMLSGGERGRLALAILANSGANVLLLDEPTNHLDLPAQEVLQEVLEHFDGTVLLVCHDRYLVDRLATQVWELRAGQLEVFKGRYREFVASRTARPAAPASARKAPPAARTLAQLEVRLQQQQAALRQLDSDLEAAGAARAVDRLQSLSHAHAQAQTAHALLLTEWEKLALEAEPGL